MTTVNPVAPNPDRIPKTNDNFESIRNSNLEKLRNTYNSCNTNRAALILFNKLLDNNIESLVEIESKIMTNLKYNTKKGEIIKELNKLLKSKKEKENLNLEKDTLLLITEERNKNIELHYIVYLLFIILLVIIEGSIVIFK